MRRGPLTLFSFGYWGWGNATSKLVKAVDAVEAARGFRPPLFVDTRLSRSVRAAGFNGAAFEQTVGRDRYIWMNGLGNEAIRKRSGPPIQIRKPEDAESLLDLAREKTDGRVIFFCSCEWPKTPDGPCHRVTVATLLLKSAQRRGVPTEVVEWPGGNPRTVRIALSEADFRKASSAMAIPLGRALPETDLLGLPWGSIAEIHARDDSRCHLVGPARFRGERWVLPKLTDGLGIPLPVISLGKTWRKRWDFEPRTASNASRR